MSNSLASRRHISSLPPMHPHVILGKEHETGSNREKEEMRGIGYLFIPPALDLVDDLLDWAKVLHRLRGWHVYASEAHWMVIDR